MAEQEASGIKQAANKVMDTAGGVIGQIGAAMTVTDDGFVESAALGDQYEIRSARIALDRSRAEPVRAAALQMIADHTASTHHLQAALEMNETGDIAPPPAELDQRRLSMLQHLEEASQDAFDKTYLDQQVMAHEETVTLMHGYIRTGTNPQLRSVALSGGPVFERHLEHMKAVRAAL